MPRKLKVYRTPIGFHDAYVAAPSQKAALAAWGSAADLFARGVAEEVTDAALMAAPLAQPGEVIRVARGSADEHMAALPEMRPQMAPKTAPKRVRATHEDDLPARRTVPERKAPPRKKPRPRPSRDAFEAAERALAEAEDDFAARDAALAGREAAIAAERTALDRDRTARLRRLTAARNAAKEDYAQALAAWEP